LESHGVVNLTEDGRWAQFASKTVSKQHSPETTTPTSRAYDEVPMAERPNYERVPDEYEEDSHLAFDDTGVSHRRTQEERKRLWWRNAIVNLLFITAWFLISITLSVYNKWMFSPDRFGFSWPLFVTTFQFLVQFGFAGGLRMILPNHFRPKYNPNRQAYATKVAPAAVATSLDIGLSNLSMKIITLSFYTMCKSSSLIFVLLFAFYFGHEKFSYRLIGVILLISGGVFMMVAAETQFVMLGFILVTSASALSGLRWSLTKTLMKDEKYGLESPAAVIFWMAPPMALSLGILSMVVEGWWTILSSHFFITVGDIFKMSFLLFLPGMIAFCMVMAEYYIVQRAGVVPMSIAGMAKEVATISVAAWLFGDELTPLNFVGLAITVGGIGLFTYHKYRKSVGTLEPFERLGARHQEDGVSAFSLGELELDEHESTSLDAPREVNHSKKQTSLTSFPANLSDTLFDASTDEERAS